MGLNRTIQIDIDASGARTGAKAAIDALRQVDAEARKTGGGFDVLEKRSDNAATSITTLGGAAKLLGPIFAGISTSVFAKSILDTGIAIDSLTRSFTAIFGSGQAAAREFDFIRSEAARLGQSLYDLAPQFKQIAAAARGTSLEGQSTHRIFSAITEASTALGLSAAQTDGALNALQQMISKGNVQAEELKGQLGERLPGAFQIAANAMGVSTKELNKMLEQGQILASDLLPKLADELHKLYGEAAETASLESAQAAINRLSQEWTEFKANLFDGKAFVAAIGYIRYLLQGVNSFISGPGVAEKIKNAEALRDSYRDLRDKQSPDSAAWKNFNEDYQSAHKHVLTLRRDFVLLNEDQYRNAQLSAGAAKVFSDGMQKNAESAGSAKAATQDLSKNLTKVATTQKNQFAELDEMQRNGLLAQIRAADKVIQLREGMADAAKRAQSYISQLDNDSYKRALDAEKKIAEARQKALDDQELDAKKVMDRIQEGTADVFYDMFQDIGKGWENLWESMKNWALRTLAELAARAATVNIVVPITTTITGTGSAGSAVASLTGGLGGLDLNSIGSLFSSSGILSKIPGYGTMAAYGGMILPGTVSLSGGALALQSGMSAGGDVASLAAAQNLSGLTGGLPISSALGYGALGGLGYSMLGGALGLPQNKYSGLTSGVGGALGAWGGSALGGVIGGATSGSVLPVVGTIAGAVIGGLASTLLGGGKTTSPSVLINRNANLWGDTSVIGEGVTGASQDQAASIASMLGQYMATQYQAVEQTLSTFGKQYVDLLQGQQVVFGRNTPGNTFSWDWGSDKDAEKMTAEAQAILRQKIYEAASVAFTQAGRDIVESGDATQALSMVSGYAADSLRTLMDAISAGVQSGDIETFTAQVQSLHQTIKLVNETWSSISQGANDLVAPPSAYESAVRQANAQFDGWLATMNSMGFAEDRVREIEEKRIQALMRLNMEMGPLAEAEASRAAAMDQAVADAQNAVTAAHDNLMDAYNREAKELSAVVSKWNQFADTLRAWRTDFMNDETIFGQSRVSASQANFDSLSRRAMIGDEDAISALSSAATQQIDIALQTAETQEDYKRTAFRTLNTMQSVEDTARRHAGIAEQQLSALMWEMSTLAAEYQQIVKLNATTMSVKDAIVEFRDAMLNLESAKNAKDASYVTSTSMWTESGYLAANPDVANAVAIGDFVSGMQHWLMYGQYEGRSFASGGRHAGGLRLVGELGPELEYTGPSAIMSNSDLRNALGGQKSDERVRREVSNLRREMSSMMRALERNTRETARFMRRWDGDGMPTERSVA